MNRYLRSRDGKTVHVLGCSRAGKSAVPWHYADDMDADTMVTVLASFHWLKPCSTCRPDRSVVAA